MTRARTVADLRLAISQLPDTMAIQALGDDGGGYEWVEGREVYAGVKDGVLHIEHVETGHRVASGDGHNCKPLGTRECPLCREMTTDVSLFWPHVETAPLAGDVKQFISCHKCFHETWGGEA